MVESLQMFLFLFKSKYRRKCRGMPPSLCSFLLVLLLCAGVLSKCSEHNCLNGVCRNETCVCSEGWQGPECQYCGGKVNLTAPFGYITDGPGNYSVSTACSWLVSPPRLGPSPPVLRIRLESFATECGWDHLYVYDGDSVRAERLLAVYSGVLEGESSWTRQVVARSGSALLHFFSDDAYAMEGFNVTYAAYSCPSDDHRTNCSSHGECEDGTCRCQPDWIGVACDQPICPEECNALYGAGTCTRTGCECTPSRTGDSCSRSISTAGWRYQWKEPGESGDRRAPPPVAGHALLVYDDTLIRVGGETFGDSDFLYSYYITEERWEPIRTTGEAPAARFAHAAIVYRNELIMYGGVVAHGDSERGGGLVGLEGRAGEVTNELWRIHLDQDRPQWSNATPTACSAHRAAPLKHCGGLHVSGHTAVLAYIGPTKKPVMLSFFGHSPHYGYLHIVQEYYIEEGVWVASETHGWGARAGFAHSAAWDDLSRRVYIHGGLVSESEATQAPSAALYEYDVDKRIWKPLPSAPIPRYLHTATFVSPGVMLVFGGNAHNDSAAAHIANPAGSRCYSSAGYIYDVRCGSWLETSPPLGAARAAHAAVRLTVNRKHSVLIHAGFDGRLRSDALVFEVGAKCSMLDTEASCLGSLLKTGRACVWRPVTASCIAIEELGYEQSFDGSVKACVTEPVRVDPRNCLVAEGCGACTAAGCVWCGACYTTGHACTKHRSMAEKIEECGAKTESNREVCARYHSCAACHAHQHHGHNHGSEESLQRPCYWDYDSIKCKPANATDDIRSVASAAQCTAPCSTFHTCANCTAEECIWCATAGRCVDKNAYGASFPLGGCRAWSTLSGGGATCGAGCAARVSCAACRAEPACGWCDDGSHTGRGHCLPGGARSAHAPHVCLQHRWHFTHCPLCQCNGHSICDSENRCIQPCDGRTVGDHCETCAKGHWGNPLNGGACMTCECNAQAVSCAADSGRCYCSTKGLAGDRCDKCDNTNHYHPDVYNKGACYYDLAVDYQFTFNLSKKEDRHLSAINFRNAPVKPDVDADFSITCSAHARMNLTVRTRQEPHERTLFTDVNCTNFRYNNAPVKPDVDADFSITCSAHARMNLTVRTRQEPHERTLFTDVNCTNFRYKFAKSEHAFGVEDNVTLTTFFVYVYDFRPPLWIQISFSQYPKLNLQQFFITFSSCFLLLLLVAAALWKIKQKYDMYRRRQRLFVEMEQMASRPFSQVLVELEKTGVGGGVPAPVALEPCRGGRAAVLSLLVRLPTGGTGRAPPLGGLAVASALVTLGHHAPPKLNHSSRARPRGYNKDPGKEDARAESGC